MQVTYFKPRRAGPESILEDRLSKHLHNIFPQNQTSWVAGSLPIGAGMPDLLIASFDPAVVALSNVEIVDTEILAYLRAVGKAHVVTIAKQIGKPIKNILKRLNTLSQMDAIKQKNEIFSLHQRWRVILPEIITIEVKMSDWRRAVQQAARNAIFAQKSFIALPYRVACRVKDEPIFKQRGVGILSITDDGHISMMRHCKRKSPLVWSYYYQVAFHLANYLKGR